MSVVVNISCISQFLATCKKSKLSYLAKSGEGQWGLQWRGGRNPKTSGYCVAWTIKSLCPTTRKFGF